MRTGKAVEEDERQDTKWVPARGAETSPLREELFPLISRRINQSYHAEKDGKVEIFFDGKVERRFAHRASSVLKKSREEAEKFKKILCEIIEISSLRRSQILRSEIT